jgi:glutamine phosphoribosylpyrophosphate amidotransferase
MCGIFAYHGTTAPDPDLLTAAAMEAARRGPHGHGWVIRDDHGRLTEHRRLGALNGDLTTLQATTGRAVLGHARLATFGGWNDAQLLQPAVANGHAIAHNGNVYNAAQLIDDVSYAGALATDTRALTAAYAALRTAGHTPALALAAVLDRARQEAWAVVILDADGTLLAHRSYHPLYARTTATGVYVSSRPFHKASVLLPDDKLVTLASG